MTIIGVTGPIAHGKTSFCLDLQRQGTHATLYESSRIITDLAERWVDSSGNLPGAGDIPAINQWLEVLLPIFQQEYGLAVSLSQVELIPSTVASRPEEYQKLFDYLASQQAATARLQDSSKDEYRSLLQWMGGYFVQHIDDGIWYKQIVKMIRQDQASGITLAVVSGLRFPRDAEILKTEGATIVGIERNGLQQVDLDDPTERQRSDIELDTKVLNDGSLEDLQRCAAIIYQDIVANQLKPIYSAST